jgi:hypothetical protein
MTSSSSTAAWVALGLVAGAWLVRLAWIAIPELEGAVNHAAEALYLAELADQHRAVPVAAAPTVESIATEVHRRTVRLLIWIGMGLGLCMVAALAPRSRRVTVVAAGLLFLLGWFRLDAYAYLGLLHGLDLKLRLVQNDQLRLVHFAVVDGLLPVVVAGTTATMVIAALRRS